MYQGNKDGEDICDMHGNYSRVFKHCSMNRKDERLHDYSNRKYNNFPG